jgi:hypothetical protein
VRDWRGRTIGELEEALRSLESLAGSIGGEPTRAQLDDLWRAYVAVEEAVVVVKLSLGEESPGRFVNTKPYAVPDERQAVRFAARALSSATSGLRAEDDGAALKALRDSRNYLRMLLRRQRLAGNRSSRLRN